MIKFILKLLNKTKYLYYIGRHDILPPPLKAIEEKIDRLRAQIKTMYPEDEKEGANVDNA